MTRSILSRIATPLPRRAILLAALPLLVGCSLGQGTGNVTSDDLFVHECWGAIASDGKVDGDVYDLKPDFFAANPYRSTMLIRIQRGNDIQEVSDGVMILIDDVPLIHDAINAVPSLDAGAIDAGTLDGGDDGGAPDGGTPDAGAPPLCVPPGTDGGTTPGPLPKNTYQVSIPAGVTPPGSPAVPPPDLLASPPIVHLALYLQRSCHNQNTILYAVSGTMTFRSLFNGDPNESQASEKLTEATFDVQIGDLRDVPLGHYAREIPCELQSNLKGTFRFYFERGQPGQPFP